MIDITLGTLKEELRRSREIHWMGPPCPLAEAIVLAAEHSTPERVTEMCTALQLTRQHSEDRMRMSASVAKAQEGLDEVRNLAKDIHRDERLRGIRP